MSRTNRVDLAKQGVLVAAMQWARVRHLGMRLDADSGARDCLPRADRETYARQALSELELAADRLLFETTIIEEEGAK